MRIETTTAGPTVSVLMTSYNREKYIGAAIESVLVQTYRDFELLIVDDCSTDGTVAIAERYAALDSRIRVLRNEKNLGQFPNRNYAATLAEGRFLKYADSDDLMYPHCLELMVSLLESAPRADVALSAWASWLAGPAPSLLTPRQCYQREFLGMGLFGNSPGAALIRRESFRSIGGFPERGIYSDALFLLHACRSFHVLVIPGDLFWYRTHTDQAVHNASVDQDATQVIKERWRALNSYSCPLTLEEREMAKRNLVFRVFQSIGRSAKRGQWRSIVTHMRNSGLGPRDWMCYLRRPRIDPFAGAQRDANGEFAVPSWLSLPSTHDLTEQPGAKWDRGFYGEVAARGV
ncbi:MAG: glycosyltransferase family 2 protein [Planctomycetaceae bacterium]